MLEVRGALRIDGYCVLPSLMADVDAQDLVSWADRLVRGTDPDPPIRVRFEGNLSRELPAEERASKAYAVHTDSYVWRCCIRLPIGALLTDLIGGDVDLFLSQVVWKNPGSFGQPLHQDAAIFPFEPPSPVMGLWIPLTTADDTSSPLLVAPQSHLARDLPHSRDPSHRTEGRYLALADQDLFRPLHVALQPGDGVLFDSYLAHASADNVGDRRRVALVLHFADASTIDKSREAFGTSFNVWTPFLRHGVVVRSATA
jgi:ectoine hydroxylase-related dioxygenase (phytanoyl-CoA dioxygenase family)